MAQWLNALVNPDDHCGFLEPTRWQGRIDPCKLSSDLYMSSVGLGERKTGEIEGEKKREGEGSGREREREGETVTICVHYQFVVSPLSDPATLITCWSISLSLKWRDAEPLAGGGTGEAMVA